MSQIPPAGRLLVLALAAVVAWPAAAQPVAQPVPFDRFEAALALADSAGAAYESGRFAAAGPLFETVAESALDAERVSALYNAACAYALAGQTAEALRTLGASVEAGWANDAHMAVDTDLASVRADAAWPRLVARSAENRVAASVRAASVDSVRIVTEDIPRFWAAYDEALPALAARDTAAAADVLRRVYLDPGTPGLKWYTLVKVGGPRDLAAALMRTPAYYASIRQNTLALPAAAPQIRDGMRRLTALYPEATFPTVYLLIGALTSGGTANGAGLLLGAEMNTAAPDSPLGELSPGRRGTIGTAANLPHVVVHELVHANQNLGGTWTLLRNAVIEGGADFLARLALPGAPEPHYVTWGRAHDRAVWTRFMAEKDGEDVGAWTGNSGFRSDDWTGDVGYYVGAEICRGYYAQAEDKAQAVRDLLQIRDPDAILAASGYAERYAVAPAAGPGE